MSARSAMQSGSADVVSNVFRRVRLSVKIFPEKRRGNVVIQRSV